MKPMFPWAVLILAALLPAQLSPAQTNRPPAILSQPQNILATNWATVAFSVGVSNSYPAQLYYQWQFNGTNLANGGNGNYPANQPTLTLYRITNSSAGPYDVVVTNIYGATTSSVATLTITVPPTITSQPAGQVVSNSATVMFNVGAAGTGPFTYQWLFDGKIITNNIITTVAGNGTASTGTTTANLNDGGAATNASLNQPESTALDVEGNLFIADKNDGRIRKVNGAGIITTLAGNGYSGYNGTTSVATNTSLYYPSSVAVDADDNLLIADTYNQRVRLETYGFLITVAGSGQTGFSGDGGSALSAGLDYPSGLAVDAVGNIYIADTDHGRIRKVDPNDNITTVAGNGYNLYGGDGGPATNASLYYPSGLALDTQGNLYVADTYNDRVRKVATNGIITTVAGSGTDGFLGDGGMATNAWLNRPMGVSVDAYGNLFIADTSNNRIRKVGVNGIITTVAGRFGDGNSGDGGAATNAYLNEPGGVTVDAYGNFYIADTANERVRKVTPQGATLPVAVESVTNAGNYQVIVSSVYGSVTSSVALLTVDLPPAITSPPTNQIAVNGGNATFTAAVAGPAPLGYYWQFNGTNLTASTSLPGTNASLNLTQVTPSNAGSYDVVISDAFGSVTSSVATLNIAFPPAIANLPVSQTVVNGQNGVFNVGISGTGPFSYQWLLNGTNLPNDVISTVAGNGNAGYSGDGGAATNASLYYPTGVSRDAAGDLYIADYYNSSIRRVGSNGIITTVAGNGNSGFSGDGGPATNASLNYAWGVALDGYGNVFIADTSNERIRKVDANGFIWTVAGNGNNGYSGDGGPATNASLSSVRGVAVDAWGNLFIADSSNYRIRKVDTNGMVTTVAGNGIEGYSGDGGMATNASLNLPSGVAMDATGNLFIADQLNRRVRRVDTNGIITTVAGNGTASYSGDGGAAINASLNSPEGVVVDTADNLYIADEGNERIRKVDASGFITTVAGNGGLSYSGDGGAAVNSSLYYPSGVGVDAYGNLLIGDTYNQRVRKVILEGPVLSLPGVIPANGGAYQVIVTSPWGSVTSSVVSLNIVFPPTITNQPAAQTIVNGSNAVLSVSGMGTMPLTYQWQFEGTNLVDGGEFSGSATSNLVVTAASANDMGLYDVIISNSWGSVTSSVVAVTIVYPPAIANPPAGQNVLTGGLASFNVAATGTGPLTYQWQFEGTNLNDGGEFSGSGTTNLVVTGATANDLGLYDVLVTNPWGSVTSSVVALNIVYPPVITNQPGSQNVVNGSNAVIAATATGTAPLSYQWQLNGVNLADGVAFSGTAAPDLILTQAGTNEAGLYDVIITNSWGSVTSSVAAVTIVFPPGIVQQPAAQLQPAGSNASFSVTATGTLPLWYQWQFKGVNLTDGGNLSGSATTNLLLSPVALTNAGGYDVVITNAWGSVTSSVAALTIAYPPAISTQPTNLASLAGINRTINVGTTGTQPLFFQWRENGSTITNLNVHDANSSGLFFDPLLTNNAGNYYVIVSNTWGSVTSSVVTVTILSPTVITSPPASQNVTNGKGVTFSVGASGSGPLTYQWLYNGKFLPYNLINTVAGQTSHGFSGDGGPATNALLNNPRSVALDAAGDLYIADANNYRIRKVSPGGIITTVAGNGYGGYNGNGLPATNSELSLSTQFAGPGVAVDADDNLFIDDTGNSRVRVDTYGILITVAGNGSFAFSGDGAAAYNAGLKDPTGVAVDEYGDIYLADTYNYRIRKVDLNDNITTVAGNGINTYAGDGGPATNASLNLPSGLALDAQGNLFIADSANERVRKLDANGIITTVAGRGTAGYYGDGGMATNALLDYPTGVAVDNAGNLYIADTYSSRIRKVSTNGIITTVAGSGTSGYSGDGGSATNAWLFQPGGVAVDAEGDLFIADSGNERVREVTTMGPVLSLTAFTTNGGNYQVIVTGAGGSVTSSVAVLTVGLAPAITQQPLNQSIVNGGNAAFSVAASGTMPLYYQWLYVNQLPVSGSNATGQASSTLAFNPVFPANAGGYQVTISNLFGSVRSSPATLSVSSPQLSAAAASGGVTLNLLTAANASSRILLATNLTPPVVWQPIYTNVTGTNSLWQFTDTNNGRLPVRFYRTATP